MRLIDAHIHLYSEEYKENLKKIVKEAVEEGVETILCVAEDLETCRATLEVAQRFDTVLPALGMHPWTAINSPQELDDTVKFIIENIDSIIAVGEVGLDKKYDSGERGWMRQIQVFKKMVELALEYGKPLNIHSRRAARDVLEILRVYNVEKAHFHWFTDDEATLREIVSEGYYVSFTPSVIYSKRLQRLAKIVPPHLVLTETDGPVRFYGPLKDKLTEPKHVSLVLNKLAEIYEMKPQNLSEIIVENFRRLYSHI